MFLLVITLPVCLPVVVDLSEYTTGGLGAYTSGGSSASPYLAADTLAKPFQGPSAATVAAETCLESEGNMGCYY